MLAPWGLAQRRVHGREVVCTAMSLEFKALGGRAATGALSVLCRWDAAAWPEPSAGCGRRGAGRGVGTACCWGAHPAKILSAGAALCQNLVCVFLYGEAGPLLGGASEPLCFLKGSKPLRFLPPWV